MNCLKGVIGAILVSCCREPNRCTIGRKEDAQCLRDEYW